MARARTIRVLLVLLLLGLRDAAAVAAAAEKEAAQRFEEELLVRRVREPGPEPTVPGQKRQQQQHTVVGHWQFTTRWQQPQAAHRPAGFEWTHVNLFPKQLAQVASELGVEELRLSFSRGAWRAQEWGVAPDPSPPGVEMWAVMDQGLVSDGAGRAEPAWDRLSRTLSGLTCSSLSELKGAAVAAPRRFFGRWNSGGANASRGDADTSSSGGGGVLSARYGQLSSEAVCTENLTPWLKLLPCRGNAGFAALIVPTTVFRARFHSFSLHLRRVCYDAPRDAGAGSGAGVAPPGASAWHGCRTPTVELMMSLTAAVGGVDHAAGSLAALQGQGRAVEVLGVCPAASASRVLIEGGSAAAAAAAAAGADESEFAPSSCGDEAGRVAVWDARRRAVGDTLIGRAPSERAPATALAWMNRFATGAGVVRGGATTALAARADLSGPLTVRHFELVPGYLRVLPSSLRVTVAGRRLAAGELWRREGPSSVTLARGPEDASLLELEFQVPPGATASVSYDFEQAFLPLDAFPPDPNRGFDLPAAAVSYRVVEADARGCKPRAHDSPLLARVAASVTEGRLVKAYTSALAVSMPLPDFSMPYNVVTLSSTVASFLFGSLISAALDSPDVTPEQVDADTKRRRANRERLKTAFLVALVALAWLFENDRDTFDKGLEALLGARSVGQGH
jgi:phosphatidylinositol glycan class T